MKKFNMSIPMLWLCIVLIGCTESSDRATPFPDQSTPVTQNTFTEVEPNNPGSPQFLGMIDANTVYIADGSVSFNDGAMNDDEFDSFTVTASGDQTISVAVRHDAGVDIDLAIVDPATGNILTELGDGVLSPETVTLTISDGQTVAIEVEAFSGSGNYSVFIGSSK